MGRKQFRQDLAAAAQNPPRHINNVATTDDGEVSFNYLYNQFGSARSVGLALLALNVDDYPQENDYMVFARDGDVPPSLANSLELFCPLIRRRSILDALQEISNGLYQVVTSGQASNPVEVANTSDIEETLGDAEDDDEEEHWQEDDEDAAFGFEEPMKPEPMAIGRPRKSFTSSASSTKIKADLRETKEAGFKIGVIGDPMSAGIVCVSIRVEKLGISEEVMKAWTLEPKQYFVVLIKFQNGCPTADAVRNEPTLSGSTEIRLGLCSSYKPNSKSAMGAFAEIAVATTAESQANNFYSSTDLQPLFIGGPLNELFRSRFTRILKFREAYCLGWSGAEQLVHDTQGAIADFEKMTKYDKMTDYVDRALPNIVMQDIIAERSVQLKHCPFPLVAMQFALRHFVRCTEFCLVCHCSSGSTFEALKPYVCSNPLCLYQYMGLGFGPSIEWEILSQPYVVDLLISFCYVQAQAGKLKDFPIGIDLKVPLLPQYSHPLTNPASRIYQPALSAQRPSTAIQTPLPPSKSFRVPYNGHNYELLFPTQNSSSGHGLKKGDFIVLVENEKLPGLVYHQVEEVLLPTIKLGPPIRVGETKKGGTSAPVVRNVSQEVDCYVFSHNFDELPDDHKCKAIMALLDTLPPIKDMRQYLKTHSVGQDSSLRQWRERMIPSALNVLRWIIASNRSCIMQVDTVLDDNKMAENAAYSEDRVSGMDDYMQFRFAQGAPDKEQRFIDCVKEQTANNPYPTLFAWHGSPLYNWHSIIREGLHFKDTLHGRAYGHGVYMSPHASTSTGYIGGYGQTSCSGWPNSELKVSSAMSLNEIVNNTSKFVSSSPHYVVAETDWIQTRYLLVRTTAAHTKGSQSGSMQTIRQDPSHTARGINSQEVQIPITAVSKSRRPAQAACVPQKRKTLASGLLDDPIEIDDDDAVSVMTTAEDRDWLLDEVATAGATNTPTTIDSDSEMLSSDDRFDLVGSPKKRVRHEGLLENLELVAGCLLDRSKTSFVPGSLDLSNVRRLPPPSDASRSASSALLKAFNTLVKTQATTVAHELGWYIDPEQIENMYQWIVELHSFDNGIPLAQDMRQAEVNSIVLEVLFTNDYPFSPPFVRVIKPRFLPFGQGGGGHVTEGGAICMELLTNDGWSAVSSIESVLLQVRLAMSENERPARLSLHGQGRYTSAARTSIGSGYGVYGVGEAIIAYERACRAHGWKVPPSFANLQRDDGHSGH
ncbi:hypothetical protein H2198_002736 [Neophaeococcomyces mojaviensis]|uniref:Uncharacterized protein n=1 Tax=Neophaeococcomyces mojaviensis TaxID=3383035 RepID=A0ACC3ADH4_9EURO|nr:hypothetical protein H2198_002736 [Knufia sp. JES_112]